jgi:hypothetical protein
MFVLDKILFAYALTITPYLFSGGLFGMVYEHLLGCFIPKDTSSWFLELFRVIAIIVRGDIPRLVALELRANKLLAMEKGH